MDRTRFSFSLFLAISLLLVQVSGAFAAPATMEGVVQSITLETDVATGITSVIVRLLDENETLQAVRVSQARAIALGLVVLTADGRPVINDLALGARVEIELQNAIPDREEDQHPVASALTTFFSDIPGINYESIMSAHEQGTGFGAIAQILWLTAKMEGDVETFESLLDAKETGDYSAFVLADGSTPKNWGQLRKAILDQDKKSSVGLIMSNSDDHDSQNQPGKDKKNDQNGNQNNGKGNGNPRDKDRDKGKD